VDRLVVDASVLCAFFLAEKGSEEIEEILETIPEIHAPLFWRFESANAIWKRKDIPEKTGRALVDRIWRLNIKDEELKEEAGYAFVISRRYNISFYDSSYIALAKSLNIPLWTLDKVQAEVATKVGVSLWGR